MKKKLIICSCACIFILVKTAQSQGCVAVRSNGNSSCLLDASHEGTFKKWSFGSNTRYFRSYKHFVGKTEQKERVERGTEVINHSLSFDFTLTRFLNPRWSIAFNLPVLSNVRSSMYEHYGNNSTSPMARNSTRSFGIGDIRITGYYWLLDPVKHYRGNIQAGVGLKLPTGDFRYTDYFHKPGAGGKDSTVIGPVDQSIQLGDGGTGLTLELNAYQHLKSGIGFYGSFYYLINPRDQNGVSTTRGGSASAVSIQYFTNTMSVPDQFMARAGASYMKGRFSCTGGVRIEGIPSSDLIGKDRGFRRPGYIISAEPVVSWMTKKLNLYLSVPVSLVRNRTKSYADKLRSSDTGNDIHGDAAFADYLINAGFSIRF